MFVSHDAWTKVSPLFVLPLQFFGNSDVQVLICSKHKERQEKTKTTPKRSEKKIIKNIPN